MYVPTSNLTFPSDVEIICPLTGESYVWIDGDVATSQSPPLGAIDRLPERFHRRPIAFKLPNNQINVILPRMT